jgi:hypothetical protein
MAFGTLPKKSRPKHAILLKHITATTWYFCGTADCKGSWRKSCSTPITTLVSMRVKPDFQ